MIERSGLLRDVGWVLAIGVLSLTLRTAYVLEFVGHPVGRMAWVDEEVYRARAQEIGKGRWLPATPFYQDPLLPYALAVLSRLVGPEVPRLRVALACVGSLTPLAIYWAGRRGLGRAEGVLAGLAAAVYGPLIFTDGQIEKEGLGALVAALALGLAAGPVSGAPRRAGATGFAWGVLTLLRSNALVMAPLGAAWLLGFPGGGPEGTGPGRRRRVVAALSFLLGFGLAIAPVTAINAVVSRPPELLLTTSQMGANFFIGNGPEANGVYISPHFVEPHPAREADDFAAEAWRRTGRALTPGQVSRFWFDEGLRRWREAPCPSLALLARKLGLLLHDFEVPDSMAQPFVRVVAAPALALGFLSFGWVAPWAAVGLGRAPRSPFWWLLVLSTAAGLGSTAVFFVMGRYRIPWTPGLLLLGAAGVVDLWRRVRARQWRATAWRVALLLIPALVLAWRPLPDPAPNLWAHGLLTLAVADLGAGRLEPALDALDDARALGPDPALRIDQLLTGGPVRERLAALIAARPQAEWFPGGGPGSDLCRARWIRQFPDGRTESRLLLDRLLQADPEDRPARRERGAWWLGMLGDPESRRRAAEDLSGAARGPAGDASAAILLALLVKDPRILPRRDSPAVGRSSSRLRLARVILAAASPHP